RLEQHEVGYLEETRFGSPVLAFRDPHGLALALAVIDYDKDEVKTWAKSPVPAEYQIRGFHAVSMKLHTLAPTVEFMTRLMGFREAGQDGQWTRFESGAGGSGTYADLAAFPELPQGR